LNTTLQLSPAPHFELKEESAVQRAVSGLIRENIIASAHDTSEGGLFIAVLESAMPRGFGFSITTDPAIRKDAFLFGEAQSRIVVSVAPNHEAALINALWQMQVFPIPDWER
jgi:phosphoribosylformylglycinamidine synthase subunit PurL